MRKEGMLSECHLHPQRLCTTHSLPSLPLKWIRAKLNIKTHSDTPSFSRPSDQSLPPGEACSLAELWVYKIKLLLVPCQSTSNPMQRQNAQPCACHMYNVAQPPWRERTTPPGKFSQPRRLTQGYKWGKREEKSQNEFTASTDGSLTFPVLTIQRCMGKKKEVKRTDKKEWKGEKRARMFSSGGTARGPS